MSISISRPGAALRHARSCAILTLMIALSSVPGAADPAFVGPMPELSAAHHEAFEYLAVGQAWGDVDRDGCVDLYLADGDGPNSLLRGDCSGGFTPWPDPAVTLAGHESGGAVFADVDDDGWLDLYVLQRGPNVLLRNLEGQGFEDVTATAGVGEEGQGQTAAWGDFDEDGDLDLYVVNWFYFYDENSPLNRDTLYRNNGDGTFEDVSAWFDRSTLERPGFSASWIDFDNDRDLDLYVVVDKRQGNSLWRNDGPGCGGWCFTDIGPASGAIRPASAMGLATGDYDNDGDLDVYYSSIAEAVLLESRIAQGAEMFIERSIEAGVSPNAVSWGTAFADVDNDGWLDLHLATMNDNPGATNRLYLNRADGTFEDVSEIGGCADAGSSFGLATADFDRDGRVDLLVGNRNEGFALYRNTTPAAGDWLRVRVRAGALQGAGTPHIDRDGLGTRIVVRRDDGLTMIRELRAGSSHGAGDETVAHFGLGDAAVEDLEIHWLDGTVQTLGATAANREVVVDHPRLALFANGFEDGTTAAWSTP
ncbi:MAG: CRTAC1 family protein [Acidobacteriota bacterium]